MAHAPMTDAARYAQRLACKLGLTVKAIDAAGTGHLLAISAGGKTRYLPAGRGCSYPFNSASAYTLARDKSHTASVLKRSGIRVIPGSAFFVEPAHAPFWPAGAGRDDLAPFVRERGYPVFAKPLTGSMGDFAEVIDGPAALDDYLRRITGRHDAVLVQPVVQALREERVVMLDGQPLARVLKHPAVLVGDGYASAGALLRALNEQLHAAGISAVPHASLARAQILSEDVLALGQAVPLAGRQNLSSGGNAHALCTCPIDIARFGARALSALGLRFGAIDYFVDALVGQNAAAQEAATGTIIPLLAIEVNCNPSLHALETAGLDCVIDRLWTAVVLHLFQDDPAVQSELERRAIEASLLMSPVP